MCYIYTFLNRKLNISVVFSDTGLHVMNTIKNSKNVYKKV